MCDIKADLNTWIEDFLRKRRFSKYELEVAGNSSKGDGYLGEVTFVKVLTGIGREEEKTYNLVIKSAKKSDEFRRKTPIKECFEREMFMYSKVFPEFRKLQTERAIEKPFTSFAKCYSIFNENQREALILQNLKYLKYDIHDRKTPQNLDHVLLVFGNYGKFHALSLALKKQKPDLFRQMTQSMTDLLSQFIIQISMVGLMIGDFKAGLELLKDEDKVTYQKLAHVDEEYIKNTLCKVKDPADNLSVILHGDCWNNNMMFAYKDPSKTKPNDMMFLDFQLSSLGSPIYDLSYYLYAVADDRVLQYFDLLMQTYHYSLTSFLNELGENSYEISLEDIKRHWIEYGKFGLVMAPFIIKIELSESDEVVDLAETAENGDIGQAFNVKIKNKQAYENRLKTIYKHYGSLI